MTIWREALSPREQIAQSFAPWACCQCDCTTVSIQLLSHSWLLQCFPMTQLPIKSAPSCGVLGVLHPHLIHGSLRPPESVPKSHLYQFSRFCRAHKHYQQTQTYTHTERPTTLLRA